MAKAALLAGYHVFVEKPMCHSVHEADGLCDLAEKEERQLVVGCELRLCQPILQLQNVIASGEIGRVLNGYCVDSIETGYSYFNRNYR